MIRIYLLAATAAMLFGCSAVPQCEPVLIKMPVTVGCLGEVRPRPENAFTAGLYPGEKAAAQAALVDAAAWEAYAISLETAQAGCDRK